MRTSYDVTIIGAGLAGLQCARLLARQGVNVLLVDRKNTLDQKIHTTGIFVRRTLVDFDLPDDCLGPPIKHVTLYSPAHRPLELVSKHDEFRVGRMGQLYQRYLQQCLHSGVDWLPQTSYVSHSATNGKVTLRLSSGSVDALDNDALLDRRGWCAFACCSRSEPRSESRMDCGCGKCFSRSRA